MHIERKREGERKPILSYPLFVPSPASSSFQHESVPWKTSKTVLGIATDLSQPSLHRVSMLFFMLLLHPPSHDATIQCAPNKSAKPPECHGWWQPRVMSRPSRFMAYLTGTQVTSSALDIVRKRAHLKRTSEKRAVAEFAYLTAILDMSGVFLSKRRTLESTRSMRRGERDGLREPGGPSRDLWLTRSAMFEGNRARTRLQKNATWFFTYTETSCMHKTKKYFTEKFNCESTKWAKMQLYTIIIFVSLYFFFYVKDINWLMQQFRECNIIQ